MDDNQNSSGQAPPPPQKPPKPEDYLRNEAGDVNTVPNQPAPGATRGQPPQPPGQTQAGQPFGTGPVQSTNPQGTIPPAASQPTVQHPSAAQGGYDPTVPNPAAGRYTSGQTYDPSLDRTVPSVSNYWDNYQQGTPPPQTGYPPDPGYPTQPTAGGYTYGSDPYGNQTGGYRYSGTPPSGGSGFFGNIKPPVIVGAVGGLSMLIILCLIVVAIILTTGNDDDEPNGLVSSPTSPNISQLATASITPISGARTPTPLPTFLNRPTPTPFQFTTSAPPPTLGVATQQGNTGNPTAIGITYPTEGLVLRGNVAVLGSASHPNFVQYAIEYGPDPNNGNLWYPVTSIPITRTVINNALGAWNTTSVPDGNYQIRLHVWLNNGIEDFRVVRVQVRNQNVPTPSTNRPPQITAISPLSITKGKAVTIALGISDPDNDPVTYLAQTSNASLVTITPSGTAAITVNGLNEGSANITIAINDGRGGTASTSFSVTVTAPPQTNNPPSISPIPSLSLTTGQIITINVTVADPDGDAVNLATAASTGGIATPSIAGRTLTIRGDKQGSVSVAVTATDARGLTATISFLVTVTDPVPSNRPPTIGQVSNQTVEAAKTLDVPVTISDPDNNPLTITATSSNDGVVSALMVGTNVIRLNGVAGGNGVITIKADDTKGGVVTMSFSVTVNPPPSTNNPPTIGVIGSQTLNIGDSITVTATTGDPDGDTVSISADAAPAGIISLSTVGNDISITGSAEGSTTVTVTASDGKTSASTSFAVQVNAKVNNPPVVDAIGGQTCLVGDIFDVPFTYSDPDGDPVTPTGVNADDTNIATVGFVDANTIQVSCMGAGTATISVTVADDKNVTASQNFAVDVANPANNPPVVDFVPDQNCVVGETPSVVFTYSDPDGNPVSPSNAESDNPGAVIASVLDANTIGLSCVGAGGANVTITVQDDKGDTGSATFVVNSAAPANNPPGVDFVDNQSCTAGDTFNVGFTYGDPDGDPVTPINAESDNGGVATASLLDANTIGLNCVGEGGATITITVQDDKGDTGSLSFGINVSAPVVNNPPIVDFINAVNCTVGETPNVPFTYSDPDGNPVTPLSADSDNGGVVGSSLLDANTIGLNCSAEGSANINVTVQDDGGQTGSTSFSVTVTGGGGPTFDVTVYAEVPDINAISGNLNNVFATGQGSGKQTAVVSFAGDEMVTTADFMDTFGVPGSYNLGNNGDLQGLVDFYNTSASFGSSSYTASNGWTIEQLLDPSQASPDCVGASPLQCEINLRQPAVMVISFTPTNALATPIDVFQSNLINVVSITTSSGVIPVLATLPDDGSVDSTTLAQYNEVIVTVAQNAQVPLWNVYVTTQPFAGSNQVYSVGNGNAFDLSDAGLASGGANRRNLAGLRVLQAIKNTYFP